MGAAGAVGGGGAALADVEVGEAEPAFDALALHEAPVIGHTAPEHIDAGAGGELAEGFEFRAGAIDPFRGDDEGGRGGEGGSGSGEEQKGSEGSEQCRTTHFCMTC